MYFFSIGIWPLLMTLEKTDFNQHEQEVIDLTSEAFQLLQKKISVKLDEIHWLILIKAIRDAYISGMMHPYDNEDPQYIENACMDLNHVVSVGVFDRALPVPNELFEFNKAVDKPE